MSASLCTILHITDCHLFADSCVVKNGINSFTSLAAVLAESCATRTPDVVIASGDIAHDPTRATYQQFNNLLRSYHQGHLLVTPGNHDICAAMQGLFDLNPIAVNDWTIVPLDTHLEDRVAGRVSPENIQQLEHILESTLGYVIVVGHHPLLDVGVAWLDEHRVQNANEVLSIFELNPNVKAYICGHVHLESARKHGLIDFWTTPSTCWQFASDVNTFQLSSQAPGWRWLELNQDGRINTDVARLSTNQVSGIA